MSVSAHHSLHVIDRSSEMKQLFLPFERVCMFFANVAHNHAYYKRVRYVSIANSSRDAIYIIHTQQL